MPMRPQGEARQATEGAAITSPTPGAGRRGQDEVPEGVHQGELPHTADCPQSLGRLAVLDLDTNDSKNKANRHAYHFNKNNPF